MKISFHSYVNKTLVSNLPFISKIVEKAVLAQLLPHCEHNAPLPKFQSGFRKFHSTETALLKAQVYGQSGNYASCATRFKRGF